MTAKENWRPNALCKDTEVSDWFPEMRNREGSAAYNKELLKLKEICADCPFRGLCLKDALDHDYSVDNGVYAGTTPTERRVMLKGKKAKYTGRERD